MSRWCTSITPVRPARVSFIRAAARLNGRGNGGILKSDDSCISNPKSEIANWTVQSDTSDFGFEMQESSDFKIPPALLCILCLLWFLPSLQGQSRTTVL